MSDEQLNKILMKADSDLEALKDRCHELYEENERLKQANKILEENWLLYMKCCEKAVEYLSLKQIRYENEDDYVITDVDLQEIINILQDGNDDNGTK